MKFPYKVSLLSFPMKFPLLDRVVPSLCVKFPRGVVYSYRWLRNLDVMVSKARLYLIPWGEKSIEQCSENRKQLLHNFSYSGKIRKWEQEAIYNSLKGFSCIELMDQSANSFIWGGGYIIKAKNDGFLILGQRIWR